MTALCASAITYKVVVMVVMEDGWEGVGSEFPSYCLTLKEANRVDRKKTRRNTCPFVVTRAGKYRYIYRYILGDGRPLIRRKA